MRIPMDEIEDDSEATELEDNGDKSNYVASEQILNDAPLSLFNLVLSDDNSMAALNQYLESFDTISAVNDQFSISTNDPASVSDIEYVHPTLSVSENTLIASLVDLEFGFPSPAGILSSAPSQHHLLACVDDDHTAISVVNEPLVQLVIIPASSGAIIMSNQKSSEGPSHSDEQEQIPPKRQALAFDVSVGNVMQQKDLDVPICSVWSASNHNHNEKQCSCINCQQIPMDNTSTQPSAGSSEAGKMFSTFEIGNLQPSNSWTPNSDNSSSISPGIRFSPAQRTLLVDSLEGIMESGNTEQSPPLSLSTLSRTSKNPLSSTATFRWNYIESENTLTTFSIRSEAELSSNKKQRMPEVNEQDYVAVGSAKSSFSGAAPVHGRLLLQCHVCKMEFRNVRKLQSHMVKQAHGNARLYECHLCGDEISIVSRLQLHVKSHGDNELLDCASCKMKFPSPDELCDHILQRSLTRLYRCTECRARFDTVLDFWHHVLNEARAKSQMRIENFRTRAKHRVDVQSRDVPSDRIRKSSQYCDRSFECVQERTRDVASSRLKLLSCQLCEKKFVSIDSLCKHLKSHDSKKSQHRHTLLADDIGVKQHSCQMCGKKCSSRYFLLKHMANAHDSTQPHRCRDCARSFQLPHELKSHVNRCHAVDSRNKPIVCVTCGRGFLRKVQLLMHSEKCRLKHKKRLSGSVAVSNEGPHGLDVGIQTSIKETSVVNVSPSRRGFTTDQHDARIPSSEIDSVMKSDISECNIITFSPITTCCSPQENTSKPSQIAKDQSNIDLNVRPLNVRPLTYESDDGRSNVTASRNRHPEQRVRHEDRSLTDLLAALEMACSSLSASNHHAEPDSPDCSLITASEDSVVPNAKNCQLENAVCQMAAAGNNLLNQKNVDEQLFSPRLSGYGDSSRVNLHPCADSEKNYDQNESGSSSTLKQLMLTDRRPAMKDIGGPESPDIQCRNAAAGTSSSADTNDPRVRMHKVGDYMQSDCFRNIPVAKLPTAFKTLHEFHTFAHAKICAAETAATGSCGHCSAYDNCGYRDDDDCEALTPMSACAKQFNELWALHFGVPDFPEPADELSVSIPVCTLQCSTISTSKAEI